MVIFNCDMGEDMPQEEAIMPLIDAANISCGFHAGNEDSIQRTIALAMLHNVKIGAHPSFADRENFGRKEMNLSGNQIYELVSEQLFFFNKLASVEGADINHVKPHGALYNMAAGDVTIALAIANAVNDFKRGLTIFCLSGSEGLTAIEKKNFVVAHETFCDRNYNPDGSLVSRSSGKAVIENIEQCINQLDTLLKGFVILPGGEKLFLKSDTICIHGDGKYALKFAKAIRKHLDHLS